MRELIEKFLTISLVFILIGIAIFDATPILSAIFILIAIVSAIVSYRIDSKYEVGVWQ